MAIRIQVATVLEANVWGEGVEAVQVTLLRDGAYVDDAISHKGLAEAVAMLRRQRWQARCHAATQRAEAQKAFMAACGLDGAGQENRLWALEIERARSRHEYRAGKAQGTPAARLLAAGIQGFGFGRGLK